MLSKSLIARLAVLGSILAVVLPAPSAQALPCGRVSGCTAFELVHAGASFNWYPVKHRYEFKGGRAEPKEWKLTGKGALYQQNGMLTLVGAKGVNNDVMTTWKGVSYTKGRWETRLRTDRESRGATDYRVQIALVPAAKKQRHCGAQDVMLLDYHPKKAHTAKFAVRNLPNLQFVYDKELSRKVGSDEWHVFGVEVTPRHIKWFVDAKHVATERRPAALSGVPMTMQARLVAEPGQRMNKTRLQLDWARYWTMKKKGKATGDGAKPEEKTYLGAC